MPVKDQLHILSYVFSGFNNPSSARKGGGGWIRFKEIVESSRRRNIQYYLVEFGLLEDLPLSCTSLVRTILQTKRLVKLRNVQIILCPIEDPWLITFAYLSSKITNRNFVVFLNSIPYFGLADVPLLDAKCFNTSYKTLAASARIAGKSRVVASFSALLWYVAFRILKSPGTKIICLNSFLASEISRMGLGSSIIPVYPGNGIDFDKISKVNRGVIKYDAIYAVGGIVPQKGVFDVIRIWALVVKSYPNAKLAIAGRVNPKDSHIINEIIKLINVLGLKHNLIFVCDLQKGLPQEELWSEMKSARIFLYPSRKDLWPLIIGEALSCGLPVVAYDLSGFRSAYDNCSAVFLEPFGDIAESAKRVLNLINSSSSVYKSLSAQAQEFASNNDWKKIIDVEKAAYYKILKKAVPRDLNQSEVIN